MTNINIYISTENIKGVIKSTGKIIIMFQIIYIINHLNGICLYGMITVHQQRNDYIKCEKYGKVIFRDVVK